MCSHHFFSHLGPTVNTQEGVEYPCHYPVDPSVKKSKRLCSLGKAWGLGMGGEKAAPFFLTLFKTRQSI